MFEVWRKSLVCCLDFHWGQAQVGASDDVTHESSFQTQDQLLAMDGAQHPADSLLLGKDTRRQRLDDFGLGLFDLLFGANRLQSHP